MGRGASRSGQDPIVQREDDGTQLAERFERVTLSDEIDEKLGFSRVQEGEKRQGWLINMHPVGNATFSTLQTSNFEMFRLW
jgi:DNA polymerase epsilon subunit 1